jgi:hypothetical protein
MSGPLLFQLQVSLLRDIRTHAGYASHKTLCVRVANNRTMTYLLQVACAEPGQTLWNKRLAVTSGEVSS